MKNYLLNELLVNYGVREKWWTEHGEIFLRIEITNKSYTITYVLHPEFFRFKIILEEFFVTLEVFIPEAESFKSPDTEF